MLNTKDLIAKLQELDPGGTMRIVTAVHEIPGADGQPEDPDAVTAGYARHRRFTFYPTNETRIDPESLEWSGETDEDAFPVIVLQGGW